MNKIASRLVLSTLFSASLTMQDGLCDGGSLANHSPATFSYAAPPGYVDSHAPVSFSGQQGELARAYLADLQRRIKRAWIPPKGNESKVVIVVFKVHKEGDVSNLRLDYSSGVAIADQAAMKAVENAAPFRPLFQLAPPDEFNVLFVFDYNAFSGGGHGEFVTAL